MTQTNQATQLILHALQVAQEELTETLRTLRTDGTHYALLADTDEQLPLRSIRFRKHRDVLHRVALNAYVDMESVLLALERVCHPVLDQRPDAEAVERISRFMQDVCRRIEDIVPDLRARLDTPLAAELCDFTCPLSPRAKALCADWQRYAAAARKAEQPLSFSAVSHMSPAFQKAAGGLFGAVDKADVGDAVTQLKDVTLMSWADPFYPQRSAPDHVLAAADAALKNSGGHYTAPIGNRDLKEAIARRLAKYNGLTVQPQRNILITPGSDSGLFFAMLPFVRPGVDVMTVDPSYPNNVQNTEILGGRVISVPVFPEDGFQIRIEEFERRITPATRLVVLTNPNNPTTTVYRRENLEALADFVIRHDLILVVDQAFEQPVFDGIEMVTAAALPGMWERTLTVCSLSKGFGMSGFRVGYIVACEQIMDKLYGTAVSVLGTANTAAQFAAIAALEDDAFVQEFSEIHRRRRDMAVQALGGIPGVILYPTECGYLSWVDVSALGTDAEVADYLLHHAKVSVNTGSPYGSRGAGHLRIVHSVLGDDAALADALSRIRKALLQLSAEKLEQ